MIGKYMMRDYSKNCQHCGKKFFNTVYHMSKSRFMRRKYCSLACHYGRPNDKELKYNSYGAEMREQGITYVDDLIEM